ncbi:MAG: hypothetical protein RSD63_06080 [Eubacterium sp.]
MISIIAIGAIPTVLGFYCVLRGKMPFIKKYNGVKNVSLHSRIEGAAALLIGLLIMAQYFILMEPATFVIGMLAICIIAFVLEIVFKTI